MNGIAFHCRDHHPDIPSRFAKQSLYIARAVIDMIHLNAT